MVSGTGGASSRTSGSGRGGESVENKESGLRVLDELGNDEERGVTLSSLADSSVLALIVSNRWNFGLWRQVL